MVHNKSEVFALINSHRDEIKALGVNRLSVFGSFVRDKVKDESDVDVIVEFEPEKKTFRNLMDLYYKLEELTGRKVDIATKESLSAHRAPSILKEAEYVF